VRDRRIQISDAPINHGRGEDCNMQDEFGNLYREDGEVFEMATKRIELIHKERTAANWCLVAKYPLLHHQWDGTLFSLPRSSDTLTIHYRELPSNSSLKCDGCDAPFTLQHAFGCKKDGLVIFKHNEV
jgi:hypothetical protein